MPLFTENRLDCEYGSDVAAEIMSRASNGNGAGGAGARGVGSSSTGIPASVTLASAFGREERRKKLGVVNVVVGRENDNVIVVGTPRPRCGADGGVSPAETERSPPGSAATSTSASSTGEGEGGEGRSAPFAVPVP